MIKVKHPVATTLPAYLAQQLVEAAATYPHVFEVGYPPRVRAIDAVIYRLKRDYPQFFQRKGK